MNYFYFFYIWYPSTAMCIFQASNLTENQKNCKVQTNFGSYYLLPQFNRVKKNFDYF